MTRREPLAARLTAVAGALLVLAAPCRDARAYPPDSQLDLTRLTFAPSLTTGASATAANPESAPESRGADGARTDRAVNDKLDAISEEESRDGFFSLDLAHELRSLAELYQERGEHDRALVVLNRAQQIVRVNEGLYSLDQAPLIRQATSSREALKQGGAREWTQNELLTLASHNPDDPRVAEIYNDAANARVAKVERFFRGDDSQFLVKRKEPVAPPGTYSLAALSSGPVRPARSQLDGARIGVFTSGPVYVDLPPRTLLALRALYGARENYNDAIYVALSNPTADGPSLRELEVGLVRSYYIEAQNLKWILPFQQSPRPRLESLRSRGAESYQRMLERSEQLGAPLAEIATELLELGDWHLVFGAEDVAYDVYRATRDWLLEEGATPDQLTAFFSPTSPVVLPTFAAGYVTPDRAADCQGYITVEIELDGSGKSTQVDVIERSAAATDAIVQRLKKHIAKSVFRPRFENGDWLEADRASLRYYFSY